MREILFRGKRVDNGEWVEGSYINSYGSHILAFGYEYAGNHAQFKVHPETVGQFTGLLDKNGKRIFEGDVLSHRDYPDSYEVVEYKRGAFCRKLVDGVCINFYDATCLYVEIIGNIHDSPDNLPSH